MILTRDVISLPDATSYDKKIIICYIFSGALRVKLLKTIFLRIETISKLNLNDIVIYFYL